MAEPPRPVDTALGMRGRSAEAGLLFRPAVLEGSGAGPCLTQQSQVGVPVRIGAGNAAKGIAIGMAPTVLPHGAVVAATLVEVGTTAIWAVVNAVYLGEHHHGTSALNIAVSLAEAGTAPIGGAERPGLPLADAASRATKGTVKVRAHVKIQD